MVNEEGRVTTLSFGDYKMPSIKDMPEQITVNLDSPYGFGPYNVRSIGEGPHIPVAPPSPTPSQTPPAPACVSYP